MRRHWTAFNKDLMKSDALIHDALLEEKWCSTWNAMLSYQMYIEGFLLFSMFNYSPCRREGQLLVGQCSLAIDINQTRRQPVYWSEQFYSQLLPGNQLSFTLATAPRSSQGKHWYSGLVIEYSAGYDPTQAVEQLCSEGERMWICCNCL